MSARVVMVPGTTSRASKSWLATALCRWHGRHGLKAALLKAQTMSNSVRVLPLDAPFDGPADFVGAHSQRGAFMSLLKPSPP